MTLPAPVADRLGKLIRMLGSDKDGEVLGAARAIKRTLEAAGSDLHDLAARLSGSSRPRPTPNAGADPTYWRWSAPPHQRPGPDRWRNRTSGERVMAMDMILSLQDLSPWELQFARDIDAKLRRSPWLSLSPRQIQVLDDLIVRAWEANHAD